MIIENKMVKGYNSFWLSTKNTYEGGFSIRRNIYLLCLVIGVISALIIGYSAFNIYNIKKEEAIILTQWNRKEELTKNEDDSITTTNGQKVIGVMKYKSLNTSIPILVGTSDVILNSGAGWSNYSAKFGGNGNSMVFGHRDSVFKFLKDINIDDELTIETIDDLYKYEIIRTEIVDPQDIIISKGSGTHYLKLITCYPFGYIGNAPQRFVVTAKLKE